MPLPDDPFAALWQVATTLREHRGDGHVAALVAAGVSGIEAHLLQVAAGRFPGEVIRLARGLAEQDWADATARLRERGLLTGDTAPLLTEPGRALLTDIETRTDDAAWVGGLAALGESAVDNVVSMLRTSVDAVRASGMLPAVNPTGLPIEA